MCVWIKEQLRKEHKVIIIILLGVWIVRVFMIEVYGILIVDLSLKMNLIVLALCNISVSINWLFLGGLVKIVMFWKLKIFGVD